MPPYNIDSINILYLTCRYTVIVIVIEFLPCLLLRLLVIVLHSTALEGEREDEDDVAKRALLNTLFILARSIVSLVSIYYTLRIQ